MTIQNKVKQIVAAIYMFIVTIVFLGFLSALLTITFDDREYEIAGTSIVVFMFLLSSVAIRIGWKSLVRSFACDCGIHNKK